MIQDDHFDDHPRLDEALEFLYQEIQWRIYVVDILASRRYLSNVITQIDVENSVDSKKGAN